MTGAVAVRILRALALSLAVLIPACRPPKPVDPPPAPALVSWGRAYGGLGGERSPFLPMPSRTNGMYLVGTTYFDLGAGQGDFLVSALKENGDVEWTKTFGGTGDDYLSGAARTLDGGVVVVGGLGTVGVVGANLMAIRVNPNGTVAWQEKFVVGDMESAQSVCATADGGFVVAGIARTFSGSAEPWILKLDGSGAPMWQNRYGGGELWALHPTSDGGFIATVNPGNDKIYLFKIDSDGVPVWGKYLDEGGVHYGKSLLTTSDGGCLLVGQSWPAATSYDALAMKIGANGAIQWEVRLAGPGWDEANGAVETPGGDFIVVGSSYNGTRWDGLLFQLHADGTLAEQRLYSGAGTNLFSSIRASAAGGYLLQGETSTYGTGTASNTVDWWVMQSDANGVFPVPFSPGTLTFSVGTAVASNQLPLVTATSITPVPLSLGADATLQVTPAP